MLSQIEQRALVSRANLPEAMARFVPQVAGSPRETAAILRNNSEKAILGLQVDWVFETQSGRQYRHSRPLISPRFLLLPFDWTEAVRKRAAWTQSILPGSIRFIGEAGMVGDNSDVRSPETDEVLPKNGLLGGGGGGRVSSGQSHPEPLRRVTLVIDGVFFADGEFAGPNHDRLFEQTVADLRARLIVGSAVQEGIRAGLSAEAIFNAIDQVTHLDPTEPYPMMPLSFRNPHATEAQFSETALQQLGFELNRRRGRLVTKGLVSEGELLRTISAWADVPIPKLWLSKK